MADILEMVKGKVVYAEDVLDLFYVASAGQDKTFVEVVEDVIENTPAADVVEVVRCKDCVHQPNLKTNTKGMMWCRKFRSEVTAIDFCSYGERTPQKEE